MNIKSFFIKVICSLMIIGALIENYTVVFAVSASELKKQQADIDNKIEETNSEIAAKKSQMSSTLNQITQLNSQISDYESEIDSLQGAIDTLTTQISDKETSIAEQEQKYATQQELLSKRLVALYETGSTTYLDMLLNADDLADFISKYYLVSQIAEYDNELLEKIENTRQSIITEKASLEEYKQEVESNKATVTSKKTSLSNTVTQKNNLVSTLSSEEASLEEQLEQFEKDKKEIASQIAALAKSSVKYTGTPSAAGFICPLSGKSKSNITTGYLGYSGHYGVDFACSAGTPILAAKGGTVAVSTSLRYSNGNYRSYGEYIIINHNDGTMTLYAHMLSGSRLVSKGQTVSQGQQIGSVGSTGNSTGNHLHFEVYVNGSRVNPTPYLP